jgi:predicted O-methyltransferase YrrM
MSLFSDSRFYAQRLLLIKRRELVDRLVKRVEYHLDPLFVRRPAYSVIDWASAQGSLEAIFPGSSAILTEQSLLEIVAESIRRQDELICRSPYDPESSADLTLAKCLYLICRVIRPSTVVETGVNYGMSSAFILQALNVNGHGKLHSIDLPQFPNEDFIGALVPNDLKSRWQLHRGVSRRLLPSLLVDRKIDLFVHDSLHTYWNMRREFELAWQHLRPGGVLISDDVGNNQAFDELRQWHPQFWKVIQQESKRALFGIVVK